MPSNTLKPEIKQFRLAQPLFLTQSLSLEIKTVACAIQKHILTGFVIFFFVGGPPTQNLIYIRANILPAGFMPAGEMKQRGADILSQHSNSSLSLSLCAGCLSTGGGGGGGLGGGGNKSASAMTEAGKSVGDAPTGWQQRR